MDRDNDEQHSKHHIADMLSWLDGLVKKASNLRNKNLADVAATARGKLAQLADHPDFDMANDKDLAAEVEGKHHGIGEPEKTQIDQTVYPNGLSANPERTAQSVNPDGSLNYPPRTALGVPAGDAAPFVPGSEIGGPDRGKEGVHVPGEPRFDPARNNPNFQQPNAVDLNPDGTLRTAPNDKGAQTDKRE